MRRMLCVLACLLFLPFAASASSVRVIQIWDDADDLNDLRPANVSVTATSDEEELVISDSEIHEMNGTTFSFSQRNLPETYSVSSYVRIDDGIVTAVFINRHTVKNPSVTVQNEIVIPNASLTITKISDSASNSDVFYFRVSLPDTYSFVTSRGVTGKTDELLPLHAGEIATITGIPVGTPYFVEEQDDPRFLSSIENAQGVIQRGENIVTCKNSLIDTIFTVYKQWEGTDNSPVILHLLADGEEIEAIFERNGNMYTVYNLPKYNKEGHEIVYSAREEYMDGYMTMYINKGKYANRSKAVYNGGTIINREVTIFFVRKEWIGVSDPPEIRFQLYQNGKPIEWRQPEKTANNVYIWKNLPKMKNGEEATYSAKEIPIEGYLIKYTNEHSGVNDAALNGGLITNYKIPKTGDSDDPVRWWILGSVSVALLLVALMKRRRCR